MRHIVKPSTIRYFPLPIRAIVSTLLLSFLSQWGWAAGVETTCSGDNTNTTNGAVSTSCTAASTRTQTVPGTGDVTLNGSTAASSNLSTGQLKGTSSGESFSGSLSFGSGGSNIASITDTVTILGDLTGGIQVDLVLAVEGLFSGTGAAYQTYAQLWDFKEDQNGGSRAQANITWSSGNPVVAFDDINSYGNQTVELLSGQPGSIEALLTMSFIVTPEDNDFTFRALLQTACCGQSPGYSGAGSVDFGNTARLGIVLPDGYSFTSESGELLSAVPIPAAAWLFGSGLIGLIGIARRKKAA